MNIGTWKYDRTEDAHILHKKHADVVRLIFPAIHGNPRISLSQDLTTHKDISLNRAN